VLVRWLVQVELMSSTGILVAAHSAQLINAMFLPQHAVVLELLAAGQRKPAFKYLSAALDLHYMPVMSTIAPPVDLANNKGAELRRSIEYYQQCRARNVTAFESATIGICARAHLLSPVYVPLERLREVLFDAVDTVGAYGLRHPMWAPIANISGQPVQPFGVLPTAKFKRY
jgi:hypothetical protein